MKIKKSHIGIVFTLVIGYFVVYYATHNIDVYIPASNTPSNDDFVIVLDAGHGAYSQYRKVA